MDLSIVTTMYFSAPYLEDFCERAMRAAQSITEDYEIVFVNDGSPDESLEGALQLFRKHERVKIVDLSRNFGHHKAMMTGLAQAKGKLVFLIDSDLEEEPEWLGRFHAVLNESGADVVYGVQEERKGGLFERITGNLFYRSFNFLTSYPIPTNAVTARLMTERYVRRLVEHKDREVFLPGLLAITGFKQVPLTVKKLFKGSSTYSLRHKVSLLVNSITSFSVKPLVFIFYLGSIIIFLATIAASYLIVRKIFFGALLSGWPSLIVSVWLLGGLTIFCLGVIGIYLSKVFMETKQRPYTVIRDIYAHAEDRLL
jgi:putative glycosyltransferase